MRKHDVRAVKYLLVFGLTAMTFLFGLLLGNYLTEQKVEKVADIEENLRIQTAAAELQFLILLKEPCQQLNSTALTTELYSISEKLDFMEAQRGTNDPDVERLKNAYSLLQIRHWLFTRATNEQCGIDQIPVMYFYSNEGDCPACKEQGYVLTYLRREYPDIRVYAFDLSTENPALNTLKEVYGVTDAPTIIMPGHRLGESNVETIETILTTEYNLTAAP